MLAFKGSEYIANFYLTEGGTSQPLLTAEDFFFAISTYNSWLQSIFGTNALI
jgi:hypothetical protein